MKSPSFQVPVITPSSNVFKPITMTTPPREVSFKFLIQYIYIYNIYIYIYIYIYYYPCAWPFHFIEKVDRQHLRPPVLAILLETIDGLLA